MIYGGFSTGRSTLSQGFSLLELLVMFALVSVFVCMAYPHYQAHVTGSRRLDAQMALLDLASRLEGYYRIHHSYRDATVGEARDSDVLSSRYSPQRWYVLSIQSSSEGSYILQATPVEAMSQDRQCQSFTLSSTGIKGVTAGPLGVPSGLWFQCWS